MRKHLLALIFTVATSAWSFPAFTQDDHSRHQTPELTGQGGMAGGSDHHEMMGSRMMMDRMGRGPMRPAAGPEHAMMMRIIFALMDGDSDGSISLQEFQAAHERLFKAMDNNKDGRLSLEEMQSFMHGATRPMQPATR